MKKTIALMLSVSMILACAGCKSEETTKKKKSTKKKKPTTEETGDPTDDPTEPTDDPTGDPTDDPTEPTDDPSDPSTSDTDTTTSGVPYVLDTDLEMVRDLEHLWVSKSSTLMQYGALDSTIDHSYGEFLSEVSVECDTYVFSDQYSVVNTYLNQFFESATDLAYGEYRRHLKLFTEAEDHGLELPEFSAYVGAEIFRADSQIISMRYIENFSSYVEDDGTPDSYYHSLNVTPDGTAINLSDVVVDLPGLTDYVTQLCLVYDLEYLSKQIVPEIKNGMAEFNLTYDAIIFGGYKFPVIGHEELFNLEYFGRTPKDFSLELDKTHCLTWDFDGDGTIETLQCSYNYMAGELSLFLNDQCFTFNGDTCEGLDWMDDLAFFYYGNVLFKDGGCFLYLPFNESDPLIRTYIFEIGHDSIEYIGEQYGHLGETRDPNDCTWVEDLDFMDLSVYSPQVLGSDGILQGQTAFRYNTYCYPLEVKSDISGFEFDWDTGEMIGDYTIKAGDKVTPIAYSPTNGGLVLLTLSREFGLDNQKYIQLKTDMVNKIDGKEIEEVFGDQIYIGG